MSDQDLVDVHFDYYNIGEDDYHAIQRLLIQLFGPDAKGVQIGPLTDLVTRAAEESGVGSVIKIEDDPYAVLTVVSCRHPQVEGVMAHVLSKADAAFGAALSSHLQQGHVGLVLSERAVNMPVQVMGPMYRMLLGELELAVGAGDDYAFDDLLFLSREGFHPEDEAVLAYATHCTTYEDGRDVSGRAMLVPSERLSGLVGSIT